MITLPRDADPAVHLAETVRRVVRLCVVALASGLAVAATLYPTYRAPDEPAHVDEVRAIATTWRQPDVGERMLSRQVVESFPLVGHRSGTPGEAPALRAPDAPHRDVRPPFSAVAPDEPSSLLNQMPQHPPLYYWLAAVWSLPLPTTVAFDVEVLWLRLLGVLLVAPLPWLAARSARHLDAPGVVQAGAAVSVLLVPMLVHIGASANNDTLLILLGGGATVGALAVVGGDVTTRRAVGVGLLTGLALLTKAFAFALLPAVALAYVVALWRADRDRRVRVLGNGVVAGAVAAAVGGWWWVRNLLTYATLQPGGAADPTPPAGFVPDALDWLGFFTARMTRRWWIEPDTVARSTPIVLIVATLILVALLLAGVAHRRSALRGAGGAVALTPVAGSLGLVLFAAWRVYARTGIPFAIHGRYLFPGVVGVAAVAAAGAVAVARRAGATVIALAVAAGSLQALAGYWALTWYWGTGGRGAPLEALRGWIAWSPVPPVVTLLPVAVGGLAAVALIVVLAGLRRHDGRVAGPSGASR